MTTKTGFLNSAAGALLLAAAAAVVVPAAPAMAQGASPPNPTMPQILPEAAQETLHGRIVALNRESRQVIMIAPGGRMVSVVALPQIPLNELNLGDAVNMTYTRSVAFYVTTDMNAPPDAIAAAMAQPVQGPGGAAVRVTRISALVVGVHPASQSVDVVDPTGGGVRTIHVTSPDRVAALSSLKPGDRVTAVMTESLASAIQRANFGG
jgi:hypothetical protein